MKIAISVKLIDIIRLASAHHIPQRNESLKLMAVY